MGRRATSRAVRKINSAKNSGTSSTLTLDHCESKVRNGTLCRRRRTKCGACGLQLFRARGTVSLSMLRDTSSRLI
eukprot:6991069-Prymnesium_polylepis.1